MVKSSLASTEITSEALLSKLYINLQQRLNSLSPFSAGSFISTLLRFSNLVQSCKNLQNSYIIVLVSVVIKEYAEDTEETYKGLTKSRLNLRKILNLHFQRKILTETDPLFVSVQQELNEMVPFFKRHMTLETPQDTVLICGELLKHLHSCTLEQSLRILEKILKAKSLKRSMACSSAPNLPKQEGKGFTLVLDLDETLGHSSSGIFHLRPGVSEFLEEANTLFELILFTSSVETYANIAMKSVDPFGIVKNRLFRQHLTVVDNKCVKDLRIIDRELKSVVIIDNDEKNFILQPDNGIKIKSWTGEPGDCELAQVLLVLKKFVKGEIPSIIDAANSYYNYLNQNKLS